MKYFIKYAATAVLLIFLSAESFAQIATPAPSPFQKVEQRIGLTDVTVEYSRPSAKGRTIFGDLLPYGTEWRTGANAGTKVTFSDDVKIAGKDVAKGSYILTTVPGASQWEVRFTKGDDKVSFTADVIKMPMKIETFSIGFDALKDNGANMYILWENTDITFPIEVDVETKVMASIKDAFEPSANTYFSAGSYYHDSGKDLGTALDYVTKATEMNPDAFWMMRKKALILADMKQIDKAIVAAQKSIEVAKAANNEDYVRNNTKSIAAWKKML